LRKITGAVESVRPNLLWLLTKGKSSNTRTYKKQ
jgi:hypothetical protein